MYRRIKSVPGVLVEVGFITNSNERYLLRQNTYQNKVCDSIIQGVLNYYK